MELRAYQQESIDQLYAWWKEHPRQNPLLVLATGAGKTVIAAHLMKDLLTRNPSLRILFMAHRSELLVQTEQKLLTVWPEAPCGVLSASLGRREGYTSIVIASRDTAASEGSLAALTGTGLIIVDEAHNIAPGEETRYRKIIDALNPGAVLGLTATPFRTGQGYIYGDKEHHLFQGVAATVSLADLIKLGYLVRPTSKVVDADGVVDLTGVRTTAGDYNLKDLEKVLMVDERVLSAVHDWKAKAWDTSRRGSVFYCTTVAHADMVGEALRHIGFNYPVVHGEMPLDIRQRILRDFANGKLTGVINVNILIEGWDAPRTDCIVMLRPTKSPVLWVQAIGRGLRPYPGKTDCLVLDYGQCIDRFGPVDDLQLEDMEIRASKLEYATWECGNCGEMNGVARDACKNCGTPQDTAADDDGMPCRWCDTPNRSTRRVCRSCGRPLNITHENQSADGTLLKATMYTAEVESIDTVCSFSRAGNPYFALELHCVRPRKIRAMVFMMFGLSNSWQQAKAARAWRMFTRPGAPVPVDPNEALQLWDEWKTKVRYVKLDHTEKYPEVVKVYLEDKDATA